MDRIVFLKGEIYISKNVDFPNNKQKTIICVETTCSNSNKTFKGVDIKTGDLLEYNVIDYIKSKTDKLYTQNELKRGIASAEHNILGRCLDVHGDSTTIGRWREHSYNEYSNTDKE